MMALPTHHAVIRRARGQWKAGALFELFKQVQLHWACAAAAHSRRPGQVCGLRNQESLQL